jgi:hypothetical protein
VTLVALGRLILLIATDTSSSEDMHFVVIRITRSASILR